MERVVGRKEPIVVWLRPAQDLWGTQEVMRPGYEALPKCNLTPASVKL